MKAWIHAAGVAALLSGAVQAQTVTEPVARSNVLSAFITGAAPAILSENVAVAPELRERLALPAGADRDAVYGALVALTDGKPLSVSGSLKEFALDAGDVHLLLRYDAKANNVAYVGLPTGATAGGSSSAPGPLERAAIDTARPQPAVVALAPVLFEFDQASLGGDAAEALESALAGKLERAIAIHLTGHADPVGEAQYNLGLSQKRAEAVRERLVALGIDPSIIALAAAGAAAEDTCAHARSREARIACLAPERRVDVSVELAPR